jgi:hypothetical protein
MKNIPTASAHDRRLGMKAVQREFRSVNTEGTPGKTYDAPLSEKIIQLFSISKPELARFAFWYYLSYAFLQLLLVTAVSK